MSRSPPLSLSLLNPNPKPLSSPSPCPSSPLNSLLSPLKRRSVVSPLKPEFVTQALSVVLLSLASFLVPPSLSPSQLRWNLGLFPVARVPNFIRSN